MKIMLILLLSVNCACAQTLTTNLVAAAPWFREVNGQLYNTRASKLWNSFSGKVYSVQNGGIVLVKYLGQRDGFQHLFVRNYTDPSGGGVARDQMRTVIAMRVGTTNIIYNGNEETFEMWDCGTPHNVMVVTTNWPASATNKVSR